MAPERSGGGEAASALAILISLLLGAVVVLVHSFANMDPAEFGGWIGCRWSMRRSADIRNAGGE